VSTFHERMDDPDFSERPRTADAARMEMAQALDLALHGVVTARPESPKVVWEALLDEVTQLANPAHLRPRPRPSWPPPEPRRPWWRMSGGAMGRNCCPVCHWSVGHPPDCPNR
jgi:hypothetical protein